MIIILVNSLGWKLNGPILNQLWALLAIVPHIVNPNNAIIAQINANPNIVTTARNELSNRLTEAARQVRQNNLQPIIDGNEDYSTSVQEGMTEGTAKSQESRVNYLDLLTAQ